MISHLEDIVQEPQANISHKALPSRHCDCPWTATQRSQKRASQSTTCNLLSCFMSARGPEAMGHSHETYWFTARSPTKAFQIEMTGWSTLGTNCWQSSQGQGARRVKGVSPSERGLWADSHQPHWLPKRQRRSIKLTLLCSFSYPPPLENVK